MKYLIIGLGNFGRTLAQELTNRGHDVIGVDTDPRQVEAVKDLISISYILDATDAQALATLPLQEMDYAIVAIGQSMEQSLRSVAALKELSVKNIIARALDQTHKSILSAMNIQKIIIPESYAAHLFAEKLTHVNPATKK